MSRMKGWQIALVAGVSIVLWVSLIGYFAAFDVEDYDFPDGYPPPR